MSSADEPAAPAELREAIERRRTALGLDPTASGRMRALALEARERLGLDAAVVVTTTEGDLVRAIASDDVAESLARLEQTSGEGPVRAAVRGMTVISVGDLVLDSVPWLAYVDGASGRGIVSVHALPLVVDSSVLGALQLSAGQAGRLDGDRYRVAMALASTAAELVFEELGTRGPETLLESAGSVIGMEVHQAQGMTMVALGVDVDEALARMRARAFARGTDLTELARDIVARRVRIDDD